MEKKVIGDYEIEVSSKEALEFVKRDYAWNAFGMRITAEPGIETSNWFDGFIDQIKRAMARKGDHNAASCAKALDTDGYYILFNFLQKEDKADNDITITLINPTGEHVCELKYIADWRDEYLNEFIERWVMLKPEVDNAANVEVRKYIDDWIWNK